jgi:hypothetical protein
MITIAFAIAIAMAVGPPATSSSQDCKVGTPLSKCPPLIDFCADILRVDKAALVVVQPDPDVQQTLSALVRATKLGSDLDQRSPKVWLAGSEDRMLLCVPGTFGNCIPWTEAYEFSRQQGVWKLHKSKSNECI